MSFLSELSDVLGDVNDAVGSIGGIVGEITSYGGSGVVPPANVGPGPFGGLVIGPPPTSPVPSSTSGFDLGEYGGIVLIGGGIVVLILLLKR